MKIFEHDGVFDWKCLVCGTEGSRSYVGLKTRTENPLTTDFDSKAAEVEIEHTIETGCKGRIEYTGGFRHRYVEREVQREHA